MMKRVTVLVVDDHALFRRGLCAILASEPDLQVVGEAGNGLEGLWLARTLKPDVVLMDIVMPEMDGVKATSIIRNELENTKVVILSMHQADEYVLEGLRVGASGYVLKEDAPEDLVRAIRAVACGRAMIAPRVTTIVLRQLQRLPIGAPATPEIGSLTPRERQVLELVTQGYRNREIAQILCLSVSTVKTHFRAAYRKLNVRTRTQAALSLRGLGDTSSTTQTA